MYFSDNLKIYFCQFANIKFLNKTLLFILILISTSCTTIQKPPSIKNIPLSQIETFNINGKISIISKQESFVAKYNWYESNNQTDISFETFLGINLGIIQRNEINGKYTFIPASKKYSTITANSLEQLLFETLDQNLQNFIELPKGIIKKLILTQEPQFSNKQISTEIIYDSENARKPYRLPKIIKIKTQDLNVKFFIENWRI